MRIASATQVIRVLDHVVALLQLLFGEVDGVALIAGLDHLVALTVPVFLGEPRDVGGFDDWEHTMT